MNAMRFYDPLSMDELFSLISTPSPLSREVSTIRVPYGDIVDQGDSYQINVELPGVKKEDIKVTLNRNILSIYAQRNMQKENSSKNFYHYERNYSGFSRSFEIPTDVQSDLVDAQYVDGVLTVVLKKAVNLVEKQIQIR